MTRAVLTAVHATWQALEARSRRRYATIGALVATLAALGASIWLRGEHVRLSLRQAEAAQQLTRLEAEIAELDQLKGRAKPQQLSGPALQAVLSASLKTRGLALAVESLDPERLRVAGTADFDQVLGWLAAMQRDQRLGLTSLSANGQQGVVKLELILTAAPK